MQNNKDAVFISVVIYARNHETIIQKTLIDLHTSLNHHFEKYEIILVDNHSSDKTIETIKNLAISNLTLIELSRTHELEYAMRAGIDFSVGDYVIEIDNPDLHFDISYIYKLFEIAQSGFDVVSLTPQQSNLSTKIFYTLMNKFMIGDIDLNTNAEVATLLSRRTLNAMTRIKDKTHYRKIMYKIVGHKSTTISYIPDHIRPNTRSMKEKLSLAIDVLFSFTTIGMSINFFLTSLFFAMTLMGGGYAIYQYLFNDHLVEGWTTIMLFLSFGFSSLFIILTIICKYVTMVLREVKSTPSYYIKQIEKI